MSIQTWKEEFYPVESNKVKNVKEALDHAILKWTGLLHANLDRHGISRMSIRAYDPCSITDGKEEFGINDFTCSLCTLFFDGYRTVEDVGDECPDCPLSEHGYCCTNPGSPYDIWVRTNNPDRMLQALYEAYDAYYNS